MNYEIVFSSERINFIKINKSLVNDYLTMVNNPNIQKCISHNLNTFTINQELQWIEEKLDSNAIIFSMIEKDTNEFIGNIEIMHINNNIGELGISITENKQDNHYGTESIKRIIKYSKDILKLSGLELNVYDFNKRAIHCYESLGFITDGQGKQKKDLHMINIFK